MSQKERDAFRCAMDLLAKRASDDEPGWQIEYERLLALPMYPDETPAPAGPKCICDPQYSATDDTCPACHPAPPEAARRCSACGIVMKHPGEHWLSATHDGMSHPTMRCFGGTWLPVVEDRSAGT